MMGTSPIPSINEEIDGKRNDQVIPHDLTAVQWSDQNPLRSPKARPCRCTN
jgi:hypothetical protein